MPISGDDGSLDFKHRWKGMSSLKIIRRDLSSRLFPPIPIAQICLRVDFEGCCFP